MTRVLLLGKHSPRAQFFTCISFAPEVCTKADIDIYATPGATGHLGGFVVKELAKASVDTTAFVRRSSSANKQRQAKLSALEALGVHILEGSLDAELADLAQLLRGFNVVISLLAMRGATIACL